MRQAMSGAEEREACGLLARAPFPWQPGCPGGPERSLICWAASSSPPRSFLPFLPEVGKTLGLPPLLPTAPPSPLPRPLSPWILGATAQGKDATGRSYRK